MNKLFPQYKNNELIITKYWNYITPQNDSIWYVCVSDRINSIELGIFDIEDLTDDDVYIKICNFDYIWKKIFEIKFKLF